VTQHSLEPGVFMNWEIEPDIMGSVPHGFAEIDGERVGIHHLATTVAPDEIEALWQETSQRVVSVRDRHFSEGPRSGLRPRPRGHRRRSGDRSTVRPFGAHVIKVENRAFRDGSRQVVDMPASFAWGHRNKRSLGVVSRRHEAKDTFFTMGAQCNVVLSNFGPVTLNSLSYEVCWNSHIERRNQTRRFTCVMQKV